jgi:putative GTP pyrophosphokinase
MLIRVPAFLLEGTGLPQNEVAEIQIRTHLQEAWAEVEHELVYKAGFNPVDISLKRKLAAINASFSLADEIFKEIRLYQRQFNTELAERQNSFFKKVEAECDAPLFGEWEKASQKTENQKGTAKAEIIYPKNPSSTSIDDLLLNALFAHNRGLLDEAISFYSRILGLKPDEKVKSLILKHRGMAYFAKSYYQEAINDFGDSLKFKNGNDSYKTFYCRGIAYSVLQKYKEAIEDYTASLELYRYQAYALYRRGLARFQLGDYTEALADTERALVMKNDRTEAQKLKDILLEQLKM